MPRRIENTNVPRNPLARSPLMRRGGAHQTSRTAERRSTRQRTQEEAANWREELDAQQSTIDM